MNIAVKNITEEDALDLYRSLLDDDPVFAECWYDCDPDFYQWCSNYDDLKHIKRKVACEW